MTKIILLINPHTPSSFKMENRYLPLGLMYLASTLRKAGYMVKLKDIHNETFGMNESGIDTYLNNIFIKHIEEIEPDFVGISVQFSMRFKPALKIAKMVKTVFRDMPIVLGGAHPTLFMKEILQEYKGIEYIVMGEGEQSAVKLLDAHFNNKDRLNEIDGIAYRKDGSIVINPKNEYIEDLDNLPFPDYDVINIEDYYFDTSRWHNPKKLSFKFNFPIITSRGCPNRCSYCALKFFHGRKYRVRSAENVVDEIQRLYDRYNCRYISFLDDNLTLSKKRVLEIMSEISRRELNIQFDAPNGIEINTMDDEIMEAMVRAGFIRTAVGIETGSEVMRNTILNKNLKNETIYNFFKMAEKYKNLRFVGFFMCGFPKDTKETLNDTFEMVKKLPLDAININFFVPFYGTELFWHCYEKGLLNVDVKNLHNTSDFSYEDMFFIKPFKLDIPYVREFRNKVIAYVEEKNAKKA